MQVGNEVMAVLSRIETSGGNARIVEQLDRKLYLKTNEVLEACGGKWSKKEKAHVFGDDARGALEAVLLTGLVTTHKDVGFFPTPEDLARDLVREHLGGLDEAWVLEPSAGTGRLVDACLMAGAKGVVAVERDERMRRALTDLPCPRMRVVAANESGPLDFMDAEINDGPFQAVLMNPPFGKVGRGDHLDHVRHAFGHLAAFGRLISILPVSVMWRSDRRHVVFREWAAAFEGQLTELPDGSFRESGTMVRTCKLVIGRGRF